MLRVIKGEELAREAWRGLVVAAKGLVYNKPVKNTIVCSIIHTM